MRTKITIIGAGNVGGTTTNRLAEEGLGEEIVLLDAYAGIAKGKALDMVEAGPVYGYGTKVLGTDNFEDVKDSCITVITAGSPRRPGMSREELLLTNAEVVKKIVVEVVRVAPETIIIMVTNPLDAMAYLAYKVSGFPRERVIGMAGVLDSARLRTFVAMELGISAENIQAMVLGSHGETMVAVPSLTTVVGVPVSELIPKERLDAIIERTRKGGQEIIELLKTGSTFYAPSAAIAKMVEAILKDKKEILPCTAFCQGEYGLRDLFIGVPVKLGLRGMEEIVSLPLTPEELKALQKSAAAIRPQCEEIERFLKGQ
ncbi:MAG TPA: malate dehydrogenase [Candidatus Brocadiales bacterium]|nr:malate dehydrogenase [Candidatus Brocadiales bacterium]